MNGLDVLKILDNSVSGETLVSLSDLATEYQLERIKNVDNNEAFVQVENNYSEIIRNWFEAHKDPLIFGIKKAMLSCKNIENTKEAAESLTRNRVGMYLNLIDIIADIGDQKDIKAYLELCSDCFFKACNEKYNGHDEFNMMKAIG